MHLYFMCAINERHFAFFYQQIFSTKKKKKRNEKKGGGYYGWSVRSGFYVDAQLDNSRFARTYRIAHKHSELWRAKLYAKQSVHFLGCTKIRAYVEHHLRLPKRSSSFFFFCNFNTTLLRSFSLINSIFLTSSKSWLPLGCRPRDSAKAVDTVLNFCDIRNAHWLSCWLSSSCSSKLSVVVHG